MSWSRSHLLGMVVLVQILSLAGCSDADKRRWKAQSPEQNFEKALESKLGDERRDAVTRIAESNYATRDDAFSVLDTVARTDPVSQVRCVALRVFERYEDNRPAKPLLMVLADPATNRDALPADADVRYEAARSLLALARKNVFDAYQDGAARDTFLRLLDDQSRSVRLIAIEALGEYKDARVLEPLIKALHNEDFAIADRVERSLIQLTGTTHDYDPEAWEKWLASTDDPFQHAGEKVVVTRPAGPSWWDQQMRAWRRGLKLGRQD